MDKKEMKAVVSVKFDDEEAKVFEGNGFFGVMKDDKGNCSTMVHGSYDGSDLVMICSSLCRVFGERKISTAVVMAMMSDELGADHDEGGSKSE